MVLPRNFLLDADDELKRTKRALKALDLDDGSDDLEKMLVGFQNVSTTNPDAILSKIRKVGRNPDLEVFIRTVKPDITDDDLDVLLPKTVATKPEILQSDFQKQFQIDTQKQGVRAGLLSEQGVSLEDANLEGALVNIREEMKLPLESQFEYFKTPEGETRLRIVRKGLRPEQYVQGFLEQVWAAQPSIGARKADEMPTWERALRVAGTVLPLVPGIGFAAKPEIKAIGKAIEEAAPIVKQFGKELLTSEAGAIGKKAFQIGDEIAILNPQSKEVIAIGRLEGIENGEYILQTASKTTYKEPIGSPNLSLYKAAKIQAELSREPGFGAAKPVSQPLPKKERIRLTPQDEAQGAWLVMHNKLSQAGVDPEIANTALETFGFSQKMDAIAAVRAREKLPFNLGEGLEDNIRKLTREILGKKFGVPANEVDMVLEMGPRTNPRLDIQEAERAARQIAEQIKQAIPTRQEVLATRLTATQPLPAKAPFVPKAEVPPVKPSPQKTIDELIEEEVAKRRTTGQLPKQPPAQIGQVPPTPPKSPLGVVEDMWAKGRKPPKEASEAYLKWQEQLNDAYFGIRRLQGQVGKGVQPGGKEDVITLLTRAPGAANAGATRYILTVNTLKNIAPNTMADDINTILFANHAKEVLAAKGPERVMAGGFKDAFELDAVLSQLEKKLGKQGYDEALQASEYVKGVYAEELSGLVNEGLVSKELAEELAQKYPWYNPLRYVDDAVEMEAQGKSTKPFSVISSGLRRLSEKGTAKESIAPLNVMADQLIRNEVRIVKNQLAKAIVNLAKKEPSLGVKKITGVRPVATVEGKEIFRPVSEDLPGTLSFFENGTRQIYEVPPFIYREANVLNKTISNPVSSLIGSLNGISRAAFTTVSPPFVVSNMLNDMLTAFVNRGIMPQQTITRLIQNLRGLEGDKIMQSFRLAGGYQQRFYGKSSQQLTKQVGVSGGKIITNSESFMKRVAGVIPAAGEAGEQAPRMALFKRQLDKTLPNWKKMSAEEIAATPQGKKAAADAVELTINFGRGGYLVKAANPFVIFLNANMEGAKLPFRVLRDNPAARWRLAAVGAGATGIAAYNLSYPEYMDIPNNIRWGSFVIMLPSKEKNPDGTNKPNYVTIVPRTREWGAFLGSLTYGMERMFTDSPDEFGTFTGGMAPMLVPLAEVPGPAILQEITGQLANWDFYYSEPIVSQSLQNLPVEEQVYPSTPRTIQLAANVAGVSPVRTQHFANGIFGGAGRAITSVTDLVANWLAPQEVSDRIKGLVEQYQGLPEDQQKDFLGRMSASDKRAMLNYLNKPGPRIPILSDVWKRVMPGRGGRLEEKQYQLEQSVDFLPSYWTDVMTPEEMKTVDIPFWTKKKKEDAVVVQDYDLSMMGKSNSDRTQYRKTNPDTDVVLNLWGHVKTVSSLQGAKQLKQAAQELGIPMSIIPAFGKTDSGKEKLPREGLWPDFFAYYAIWEGDEKTDSSDAKKFRQTHPEFEKWGEANLGWKPLTSTSTSRTGQFAPFQIAGEGGGGESKEPLTGEAYYKAKNELVSMGFSRAQADDILRIVGISFEEEHDDLIDNIKRMQQEFTEEEIVGEFQEGVSRDRTRLSDMRQEQQIRSRVISDLTTGVNPPSPKTYPIGATVKPIEKGDDVWTAFFTKYIMPEESQKNFSNVQLRFLTKEQILEVYPRGGVIAWYGRDHIGLTESVLRGDPNQVAEIMGHEIAHHFYFELSDDEQDAFARAYARPELKGLRDRMGYPRDPVEGYAAVYSNMAWLYDEQGQKLGKFYKWAGVPQILTDVK